MAVHYERDDSRRRITIMTTGVVTPDEVRGALDRQAREGTWSYCVLYDTRAALNMPTPDDLRELVLHVGMLTTRCGRRGPVALISNNREFSRLGRAYSTLGELTALDVAVFGSVEEAEAWLAQQQPR